MRKLLTLLLFVIQPYLSCPQTFKGKVTAVADGDTFTILLADKTMKKVRLHGIDCPEKGQDFGNVAKQFTIKYCKGKNVILILSSKDKYRRTVGLVLIGNDTLNVALLKAGLAWHFKKYDRNAVWDAYEHEARKKKMGLWAMNNAVAPWEWRKVKRRKAVSHWKRR